MTSSNNNICDNTNNDIINGDDIVVLIESGTLECRETQQHQTGESDDRKRRNEDAEVLIDANNPLNKQLGTTTRILNGAASKTQNPAELNMVMRCVLLLTTQ